MKPKPDSPLNRCWHRVLLLERHIRALIAANDASEAGNLQKAIEQLRRDLEEI